MPYVVYDINGFYYIFKGLSVIVAIRNNPGKLRKERLVGYFSAGERKNFKTSLGPVFLINCSSFLALSLFFFLLFLLLLFFFLSF